jgi:PAS domain S-box-containing protein
LRRLLPKRLKPRSLQARTLAFFILLALAPAALVLAFALFMSYESSKQQIFNQLESVATLKTEQIHNWVSSMQDELLMPVADERLSRQLDGLLAGGDGGGNEAAQAQQEMVRLFRRAVELSQWLDAMFLLSADGSLVLATDDVEASDSHRLQAYYTQGLDSPAASLRFASDTFPAKGRGALIVSRPIRSRDGETLGVLCGRASLKKLQEVMTERSGLGESGETYLVASDYTLATSSRFEGYQTGDTYVRTEGVRQVLENQAEGYGLYLDYRKIPIMGVYRWLPDLEMVLLSEIDQEEAFRSINRTVAMISGGAVLIVLLAGVAGLAFSRRITGPLLALVMTAKHIAGGRLDARCPVQSDDEIGSLSASFNTMADELTHRIKLENLVADISRACVDIPVGEFSQAIDNALEKLGRQVGVDRVYLVRKSTDDDFMSNANEWCAPEIASRKDSLQNLASADFPWFMNRIETGWTVWIPDVNDLPEEAAAEKQAFEEAGVKSLLCVPLDARGEFASGFIGFDSVKEQAMFSEEDIRLLQLLAEVFCGLLDRVHYELKLTKSEERLRKLIDENVDALLITDAEGRMLFWNPAAARLFALRGKSGDQGLELPPSVKADLLQQPESGGHHEIRVESNGDVVVAEARSTEIVWQNQAARMISLRDVTIRKKMEQEVLKAQQYVKNIIDSMPSMMIGVDPEGMVTQWNLSAEKVSGVSQAEALGRPLAAVAPSLVEQMDKVGKAIRERQTQTTEKLATADNGETHFKDVVIYPLIANGVDGAVIRVDDITERVRIEEMMIQSEKMMTVGGLAAGMAHEINNPLGGIMGAVQVIQQRLQASSKRNQEVSKRLGVSLEHVLRYLTEQKIIKYIGGIQEMSGRASQIIKNVLNFSRRSESKFTPIAVETLIQNALDLAVNDYDMKKQYDFKNMEVVQDIEPGLPEVVCTVTEIEQVLLNFFKNAVQAMSDNEPDRPPRLVVRAGLKHGDFCIEVEDNGPGMDEQTRKRALEPFFTTKEVGVGTGLGLSVSYFIVTQNHMGDIAVESKPGQGAKFIITLPGKRGTA